MADDAEPLSHLGPAKLTYMASDSGRRNRVRDRLILFTSTRRSSLRQAVPASCRSEPILRRAACTIREVRRYGRLASAGIALRSPGTSVPCHEGNSESGIFRSCIRCVDAGPMLATGVRPASTGTALSTTSTSQGQAGRPPIAEWTVHIPARGQHDSRTEGHGTIVSKEGIVVLPF